jgi:hypothetical protein
MKKYLNKDMHHQQQQQKPCASTLVRAGVLACISAIGPCAGKTAAVVTCASSQMSLFMDTNHKCLYFFVSKRELYKISLAKLQYIVWLYKGEIT